MCRALDRGAAFEDTMGVLMSTSYGRDAAGACYGLTAASFCHSTWRAGPTAADRTALFPEGAALGSKAVAIDQLTVRRWTGPSP